MQQNSTQQSETRRNSYLKPTNNLFYNGIISELEDDEDPVNFDFIFSTIVKTQNLKPIQIDESFSNLTKSQKELQTIKIYQQSRLNSCMFQVRQLISNSKQQILHFLVNHGKRSAELMSFCSRLEELDEMIKSGLGATDSIKIFLVKRVIEILNSLGKIPLKNYKNLVNSINQLAGIDDKKLTASHHNPSKENEDPHQSPEQFTNSQCIKRKIQIKCSQIPIRGSKRSLSMKLCLEQSQSNKPQSTMEKIKRVPYFYNPSSVQDLSKILKNVDEIHENHLRTWQRHNEEMKEFDAQRIKIRQQHSSFHSKMVLNRKVNRHSSLNQLGALHSKPLPKLGSFEKKQPSETMQQPEEPRRLINETDYFSRQSQRKISMNQNEIRLKLQPILGGKNDRFSSRIKSNSWLDRQEVSRPIRQKSRMISENKTDKSPTKSKKSKKSKSKKLPTSRSKAKSTKLKSNSVQKEGGRRVSDQRPKLRSALKSGNAKKNLKVTFQNQINSRKLLKL